MQYFILPIFLSVFSELLGTSFLNKFKIKGFRFNGLIGFSLIMALYYVLCFPLVALSVKFSVLLVSTILFFIVLSAFIFLNRKELKITFNLKEFVVVLLIVLLQVYFASRNTVGSLWRYDTITYTNMISGSIYGNNINALDYENGFGSGFYTGYSFQAYYKLASVLYYLINGICNVLHIEFFYFTQHTWMYSLLLYIFVAEMLMNFINELNIKNKWTYLAIFLFFILFMGNFYWNSEQAYLGNSFRMIMVSYCLYYLDLYFKENDSKYLLLLIVFNYANTACANCNSTLALILTFVIWVFMHDNKNSLRYLLVATYLPLINCLFQSISYSLVAFLLPSIVYAIIFIFADNSNAVLSNVRLKKTTVVFVGFMLIALSYKITHNLLDFDAFLNNMSGWSDMTWDYTDFSNLWRSLANIVYFALMALMVIYNWESKLTKMLVLTALVFFNPFAAPIQNEYMPVFYRNYDIVINYFTLFSGYKVLEELSFKKTMTKNLIYCVLILAIFYVGYNQLMYHPSDEGFEKDEDYNELLKMNNDTADTLLFMKDVLANEDKSDIRVISSIYQIRTEFPYLKTLYNRGKQFNGIEKDYELYKVFFPEEYYGDGYEDADYENVGTLLAESDYKYLILAKDKLYYDKDQNTYYSLTYKINELYTPIYDNNNYSVYLIH